MDELNYYDPVPSEKSGKKYKVKVWDPNKNKAMVIHFGASAYQDYTQHHDAKRKDNYLRRSAGITKGDGTLTKDDPLSANYWSRRYLWLSCEPWYFYLPPGYKASDLTTPDGRRPNIIN